MKIQEDLNDSMFFMNRAISNRVPAIHVKDYYLWCWSEGLESGICSALAVKLMEKFYFCTVQVRLILALKFCGSPKEPSFKDLALFI